MSFLKSYFLPRCIADDSICAEFHRGRAFPLRLQSLFSVHDKISQKDFTPKLAELPLEVDEDEETVKIVQLVKSNEPLVSRMFRCFYFILF